MAVLGSYGTARPGKRHITLSHEPFSIEYDANGIDIHLSHVTADLSHEPCSIEYDTDGIELHTC